MKKEELQAQLNGVEISDEAFSAVYNIINKSEGLGKANLENEMNGIRSQLDEANAKNAEYEKAIEGLKANASANDEVMKELESLRKAQKEREKIEAEATRNSQINDALSLVMGDKKFVNDYTKSAIVNEIKTAMNKDENRYKGVEALFNEITKDREGIFENTHQMPNMPSNAPTEAPMNNITKEQFRKMPYSEREKLFMNNRELYDTLAK